jgi:prevent-host-death family protein
MSRYGVAEAKNSLASLLDKAMAGEEVIITRHGKAIVELRPVANPGRRAAAFDYEWLRKQRDARKPVGITSVALLKALHDESDL